jgi:hypothetical protein
LSPQKGGILWDDINFEHTSSGMLNFTAYGQIKAGSLYQAAEFARQYSDSGIRRASVHPGH